MLTQAQHNRFTEIIRNALSKAAYSLSELSGYSVTLHVPKIIVLNPEKLSDELTPFFRKTLCIIETSLPGNTGGNASLLIENQNALYLVDLLTGLPLGTHSEMDCCYSESISETGGIIINTCVAILFGSLGINFSPAIPSHRIILLKGIDNELTPFRKKTGLTLRIPIDLEIKNAHIGAQLILKFETNTIKSAISKANPIH